MKKRQARGMRRGKGSEQQSEVSERRAVFLTLSQVRNLLRKRPLKPIGNAMYSTRQLMETFTDSTGLSSGQIVQSGSSTVFGSIAFEAGDLDNFTDLSGVFDQYRIDRIELLLRSVNNTTGSLYNLTSPNQALPRLYTVIDRDDSSALSSLAAIREYDNVEEGEAYESQLISFKPSISPAYYASGSFVGYGIKDPEWLDVASSGIPHYGVKWAVSGQQTSSTNRFAWDVECFIYVSWKNTR